MTHTVTKENIALVSRMYAVGVTQADLALLVGLSCPKALKEHYGEYMTKSKAITVDEVCGALMKLIKKGNFQAIKLYLQCQGGWKLEDKQEVNIPVERVDKIKIEMVSFDKHEHEGREDK